MGKVKGLGTFWPELGKHSQDFRDDLSGLAHHDRVAAVEIQFRQSVGVVQGGATDAGASEGNRFEFGHWGDHAGAPHLVSEAHQPAWGFFGWVFQSDGPAWSFLGEACGVLQP